MLAPSFDDDLRLHQIVDKFDVQAFVVQFSVEGFVVAVIPMAAAFDVMRLCSNATKLFSDRLRPKLASNVAPNVIGDAVRDH